jgi:hypothetical protein
MSNNVWKIKKKVSKGNIIALLLIAIVTLFFFELPSLSIILGITPGPEGVSCSLYSTVAYAESLTHGAGVPSILGTVNPNDWIAYRDYTSGSQYLRAGYQWERPSTMTPVIKALLVDRNTSQVISGINLQIRIQRPTMQEVNIHGDPTGGNPTQIDWYSFQADKTTSGNTVTWNHYEAYVVPVDFIIELSIRPLSDKWVGDFQSFDLWMVLDTTTWLNTFTYDQTKLLNEQITNATITAYNYKGAFPIWAWVGAWDPWVVSGRDGNPDKFYDPADLSPEEMSDLQTHLQLQPSFGGSPIELYTKPGYKYERLFAEDIIKNPELLKQMIQNSIPGLPDPRFAETVYFPLTLINFGALQRSGGWWLTAWDKEYYPTAYMRVRALYAVYGEWTYLWTQEEANKQGYQWQNNTSQIKGSQSEWDKFFGGLSSWFGNPLNEIWLFFILIIAVIVIVTIFNPGLWASVAISLKKSGGSKT